MKHESDKPMNEPDAIEPGEPTTDVTPVEEPIADGETTVDVVTVDVVTDDEASDETAEADQDIASRPELTDREAQAIAEEEERRRADPAVVRRWTGRGIAGVLAMAAAGALVVFGLHPIAPLATATPGSALAVPGGFSQSLSCAPSPIRIGTVDASDASAIATTGDGNLEIAGDATVQAELPVMDDLAGGTTPLIVAPPDASHAAATETFQVNDETVGTGLAASACSEPSRSQWLVGGSTTTGRQSILSVANPTDVIATVSVVVYSEDGVIRGPGSTGIDIPAGQTRIIDLASLAPGLESIVVQVESAGTPITAHLQSITTRVLVPGGLDIIDPVRGPSETLLFPGLRSGTIPALASQPGFEDLTTVLRILAADDATIEMSFVADNGEAIVSEFQVEGGEVADIPLDRIPEGTYHIAITSDVPLIGGLLQSVVGPDDAHDYDWIAAAGPVEGDLSLAVPTGPSPMAHFLNATNDPIEATLDEATVQVPPHSGVSLPVTAGSHTVSADAPLGVAISYLGDTTIAGFSLQPKRVAAEPIDIVF